LIRTFLYYAEDIILDVPLNLDRNWLEDGGG